MRSLSVLGLGVASALGFSSAPAFAGSYWLNLAPGACAVDQGHVITMIGYASADNWKFETTNVTLHCQVPLPRDANAVTAVEVWGADRGSSQVDFTFSATAYYSETPFATLSGSSINTSSQWRAARTIAVRPNEQVFAVDLTIPPSSTALTYAAWTIGVLYTTP